MVRPATNERMPDIKMSAGSRENLLRQGRERAKVEHHGDGDRNNGGADQSGDRLRCSHQPRSTMTCCIMPCLAPGAMTHIKLAAGKSESPGAISIAQWLVCRPGCPGLLPRRFEPGSRVGPEGIVATKFLAA